MKEDTPKQILLIAPQLLAETLVIQIEKANKNLKVILSKEELTNYPTLVIWSVDNSEFPASIDIELNRLKERWNPAPILLLIPDKIRLSKKELLELNCTGLLQAPNLETLNGSIETLIKGGRVVRIKESSSKTSPTKKSTLGLGQWLLVSGVDQINDDLEIINLILDSKPENPIFTFILMGRIRELKKARSLLFLIWGPQLITTTPLSQNKSSNSIKKDKNKYELEISLEKTDSEAVWHQILARLETKIKGELLNSTGEIFALEAIKPIYKKDLLISLLAQFSQIIGKFQTLKLDHKNLYPSWLEVQKGLRQQTLRSFIGSYTRLSLYGQSIPLADELIERADLTESDQELPNSKIIIEPLILNEPVAIDGQLLPPDDPRALIHLEMHINNWLIRTAEIICSELISISSEWPEFRHYLLNKQFISTRELERLRNQLNSQSQWQNLIKRPIRLYESKRILYTFDLDQIESIVISEPRDEELRKLSWSQQQITLLIEARDAVAPQLQALVKYIGDFMVVLLTQIIGRAIGLIGKGIAQGMGRTLNKG